MPLTSIFFTPRMLNFSIMKINLRRQMVAISLLKCRTSSIKLQLTKFQLAVAYKVTMFAVFVGCSICSCSVVVVIFVSNRDSSYAIGIFNLYKFSKTVGFFKAISFFVYSLGVPRSSIFLCPSVTPWKTVLPTVGYNNPGIRLFKYDRNSAQLKVGDSLISNGS